MKETELHTNEMGATFDRTAKRWRNASGRFTESTKKMTKDIRGIRQGFQFQYLGILFFGMAIQRIFMGIARSATTAFLKITEGGTQAGQSILALQAGFAFLAFSVGDALGSALMPLMPTILEIIEGLSDWISEHKLLVSLLLGFGLAVGTFMLALGTLKLGISSMTMAAGMAATGGLGRFIGLLFNPAVLAALLAIGVAAIVIATNWDVFGKAFSKVGDAVKTTLFDMEADILEIQKKWDEAIEAMWLASATAFTRIIRAAINMVVVIMNIFSALQRYMVMRVGTMFGGDVGMLGEFAGKVYPPVKPPKFLMEELGRFEKEYMRGLNITVGDVQVNAPTSEELTKSDLKDLIKTSWEEVIDEIKIYTNTTVR